MEDWGKLMQIDCWGMTLNIQTWMLDSLSTFLEHVWKNCPTAWILCRSKGEVVLDVAVNWLEEPWHRTQISCCQGHNFGCTHICTYIIDNHSSYFIINKKQCKNICSLRVYTYRTYLTIRIFVYIHDWYVTDKLFFPALNSPQGDAPEILWHHPLQRGSLCTVSWTGWMTNGLRLDGPFMYSKCLPTKKSYSMFSFIGFNGCLLWMCPKVWGRKGGFTLPIYIKPCQWVSHV